MPVTWTTVTDPIGDTGAFDSRMIFGDFDGDGDIDILYQNGNTAGTGIGYLQNNGNGTFVNYTDATAAGSIFAGVDLSGRQLTPANFFIFDFDRDGDLDILDRTSGTTTLFQNNANAGFTRIADPIPDTGSFDQRMVWGDFDGDGDVDALYQNGNTAGSGIGFLRNDGGLNFTNFTNASAAGTPFTGVSFTGLQITASTFVIDIDDDGDMDILDRGSTQVMYRNDAGSMVRTTDPLTDIGSFDARMITGDFDSDGDTDVIYQNGNTAGTAFGYFQNNGGTFTNFTSLTGTPFAGLDLTNQQLTTWTTVDIDGDGDVDIVDRDQAGGGLVLYRQNGAPPVIASSTPSDNATGVAVGANITLTFSESVTKGAGNIYLYRGDGTLIETISVGSAQVTGSGTTWTIDPSVTLAGLTNYYVLIDQETFADADGAVFAGISNATTLNFTTVNPNTAPTFTSFNGDAQAFTEGTPVRIEVAGNANVADAEQANFNGGTLTVTIAANGVAAQDVLSIANIGTGAGQISVSGAAVSYQGVQIGTFTGGTAGAALVITLDSDATVAATQALVRALQYNNTSDAPNTATRTITTVLTDGAGGTSATQTTTLSITATNDPHTGGASISGTTSENGVLTAVSTLVDPDGLGTLHYQWQRDTGGGYVNVGADQSTYTLGDSDVGGVVRVVIYYTDAGGTVESATSAGTAAIAAVNDPHTGGASITGTATEDQVLTAVSNLADVDGLGTLHYNWQRDTGSGFVSIGAADQATYTLGDADVGGVVRVVISYTDGQGFSESATSAGTAAIANVNDPHTGGASLTGTASEDQVLTAVSTIADADGLGVLHYQWQRDIGGGYVNVGADQSTYTLGDSDIGGVVRVVIYYTDAGGTVESATSAASAAITASNDTPTGGVSITGTTTEDQVLTADTSTLADSDGLGTLHYDWQRDTGSGFVSIGAADQATYTLGDADTGGVVRVVVSYTDGQGFSNAVTSAATAAIAAVNDPHTGGASITGTATENQVLTAVSTLADADGLGTLHYDWQRDTGSGFVSTGAADQATYTLDDADVGGVIRVVISYTDAQGFAESTTSASTAAIANVNDVHTGGVSITGTATEDQVLTAVSTLADVDGLGTIHYQWQRDTGGGFVNVGADQATYTLGDADVGGVIRVVAYYTDGLGTVESATSAGTNAIANVDDAAVAVDDSDSTLESAVLNGSVVVNDTDIDGPAFVVSAVNGAAGAVGNQIALASGALLTLNANGTYSYDPNGAFTDLSGPGSGGTNLVRTDSFTYTLANGNTATVTITVVGEDSPGDVVQGDSGDNTLTSGDGSDTLVGGGGNDTLIGGDGVDEADYSGSPGGVHIRLNGGFGDDGYGNTDTLSGIENLTGSGFNDILIGAAGGNVLNGGGGSDVLLGLDGDDTLVGGSGAANQLQGGLGDDDYFVEANDTIIELLNQGHDRVFTTRNAMTLVANVEELHFTGAGNFAGTGNILDNTIVGGDGDDLLSGRGGSDTLHGGSSGSDTVTYAGAMAGVSASLLTGAVGNDGDGGSDTLIDIENLLGSAFNDNLVGDNGANILQGGAGNDIIRGNGGNDSLNGGIGTDYVSYSTATSGATVRLDMNSAQDGMGGTDTIVAFENVIGSAHADLIVGDAAGNVLQGEGGADVLIGRGGNDNLFGGAGAANTLFGGEGDDFYMVEANDTIVELAGEGNDTVLTARNQFTLAANVENLTFNGTGNFAGTGNASNNIISGGGGLDTLIGGGGNDTLNGGLGHDTARFTGLASEYLIEDLGGGQYRVTDTVGGRDGVDILNGVEQARFSDSTTALGGAGAPALTAKQTDMAQVMPLMDDDFLFGTLDDQPVVLPAVFDADDFAIDGFDGLALAPVLREAHAPDGSLHLIDSWHTHDDWMF
ncbi:beta strand repeat-containing protein [Brevundimonas lenta]|uniref:Ca2+-binding RTX toxin-like protein/methionine-rich copper-binding protein CopC n=1 Tax=Brevundimonas lenta TaxID=424796 RepID=A0A7W6JB59_9CAUL|nr:FG-GAP-like repeat-containing protein [Brevundimonas lenta]MBB4081893.1 Ca2+-binding RTX toxin-like protein/methionine-rich copper-binding protein CopC [Brevundimonas lenta]